MGYRYTGEQARVVQKDLWVLERFQLLFGGSIGTCHSKDGRTWSYWHVSGARARGFLMSIYGLLSPRRQEQIRKAMRSGEFYEELRSSPGPED